MHTLYMLQTEHIWQFCDVYRHYKIGFCNWRLGDYIAKFAGGWHSDHINCQTSRIYKYEVAVFRESIYHRTDSLFLIKRQTCNPTVKCLEGYSRTVGTEFTIEICEKTFKELRNFVSFLFAQNSSQCVIVDLHSNTFTFLFVIDCKILYCKKGYLIACFSITMITFLTV